MNAKFHRFLAISSFFLLAILVVSPLCKTLAKRLDPLAGHSRSLAPRPFTHPIGERTAYGYITIAADGRISMTPPPPAPSTYYVDYASGSDANDGLAKTAGGGHGPWKDMPGAQHATGVVAAYTMTAGDQIIFKGGVDWAMNTIGCWALPAGHGTAGNPVYFGVDQTWFAGSSWTRPILDAHSVNLGTCQEASPATMTNNFLFIAASYITIDNFEWINAMEGSTSGCGGVDGVCDSYIFIYSGGNPTNDVIEHNYFHAVHTSLSNCQTSGCEPWTSLYNGTQAANYGNSLALANVFDGSDSDDVLADPNCTGLCESNQTAMEGNWWEVSENIAWYVAQGFDGEFYAVHDNNVEWVRANNNSNGGAHGNGLQYGSGTFGARVYGNFFAHLNPVNCATSGAIVPAGTPNCTSSLNGRGIQAFGVTNALNTSSWIFDNVVVDTTQGGGGANVFNVLYAASDHSNRGSVTIVHNTVYGGSYAYNNPDWDFSKFGNGCAAIGTPPASYQSCTWGNNHVITNTNGAGGGSTCTSANHCTDLGGTIYMLSATAATDQYTSSEPYVFSPPFVTSPTVVQTGVNLTSDCTIDSFMANLCSDTTYGVSYDQVNHKAVFPARTTVGRPASGGWQIGAYTFNTGAAGGACTENLTTAASIAAQAQHKAAMNELLTLVDQLAGRHPYGDVSETQTTTPSVRVSAQHFKSLVETVIATSQILASGRSMCTPAGPPPVACPGVCVTHPPS